MFARSRPLVKQCTLYANRRPYLLRRSMASSTAYKQEWLVILPDHVGASEKRQEVRPAHLKAIKPMVDSGFLVLGGALLEEPKKEGQSPKMKGSVLIAVAETKEEVVEILKADVYTTNNVWDWNKVQVYPFASAIRTAL